MTNENQIIIIGGGAAGLSLAYNLLKKKVKIIVLEGTYLNGGATGRNTGIVKLSLQQAIDSNDLNLLKLAKMGLETLKKTSSDTGINIFYRKSGSLKIAKNEEELKLLEQNTKISELLKEELISPEEIEKKWKYICTKNIVGGSYNQEESMIHPFSLTWAYNEAIKKLGGTVLKQNRVKQIIKQNKVFKVVSEKETYQTDTVVIASGIYSKELAEMMNYTIPLSPIRKEVLISEPMRPFFGPCIERPKNDYLIAQTLRGEFMGTVNSLPSGLELNEESTNFLTKFANETLEILPTMSDLRIIRQWTGIQDTPPDNKPIIGELEEGLYINCGYCNYGITLSPIVGKLLSEEIVSKKKNPILKQFDPHRFKLS